MVVVSYVVVVNCMCCISTASSLCSSSSVANSGEATSPPKLIVVSLPYQYYRPGRNGEKKCGVYLRLFKGWEDLYACNIHIKLS